MSYDTLKTVLWILLCIPCLVIGILAWGNVISQSLEVEKHNKKAKTRAQRKLEAQQAEEKRLAAEKALRHRMEFDENYRETHGF